MRGTKPLYTSKFEQIITYILYMYSLQLVYVFYIAMDTIGMGGRGRKLRILYNMNKCILAISQLYILVPIITHINNIYSSFILILILLLKIGISGGDGPTHFLSHPGPANFSESAFSDSVGFRRAHPFPVPLNFRTPPFRTPIFRIPSDSARHTHFQSILGPLIFRILLFQAQKTKSMGDHSKSWAH